MNAKTEIVKLYVVLNGSKNLLGKITSKTLGVLKLGLVINKLRDGTFPKFKDVIITIPIGISIKSVCQRYRRVLIPLKSKINEKIQELMKMDINEPANGP